MSSMRLTIALTVLGAFCLLPFGSAFAAQPAQPRDSKIGQVLADAQGMTLYTFDKDAPGVSNCTGKCAENWPPLMANDAAQPEGDFSLVTRPEGTKQWAYKGKPLYTWKKDAAPGDVTGDDVNHVWHVVRP